MTSQSHTQPPTQSEAPYFDHERLQAYQLALQLYQLVGDAMQPRGSQQSRSDVERAVLGLILNIARGAGHTEAPAKRAAYSEARSQAMEAAALFDVLHLRRAVGSGAHRQVRAALLRITQMLSKLCQRLV